MAVKQIDPVRKRDAMNCPRCGSQAIIIDGQTVQWLNCPKCKFKKLMEKHDDGIKITSI